MSDTPRTDAALVESILCTEGGDEECTVYPAEEHVTADFARDLERENAELRKNLTLHRYSHDEIEAACGGEIALAVRKDVLRRRAAILSDREQD